MKCKQSRSQICCSVFLEQSTPTCTAEPRDVLSVPEGALRLLLTSKASATEEAENSQLSSASVTPNTKESQNIQCWEGPAETTKANSNVNQGKGNSGNTCGSSGGRGAEKSGV